MDKISEQFGAIYDQYIDKIYRFVFLKVNGQEIAEDITSKVFLKAFESYKKQSKKIENIGAFLYKIANNAVIDYYRERGRTNVVSSEIVPEITDNGSDIEDRAILNADVDVVKKAIQGLQKEHQDIIIWYYLEDIAISEIAKLLGKPEGTVRVMLHRGLKSLKEIIQES